MRDPLSSLRSGTSLSRKSWLMVDMSEKWVHLIAVKESCFSGSSVGYSFGLLFLKPPMWPTLACLGSLQLSAKTVGCFHLFSLHAALPDITLRVSSNASQTFAIKSAL